MNIPASGAIAGRLVQRCTGMKYGHTTTGHRCLGTAPGNRLLHHSHWNCRVRIPWRNPVKENTFLFIFIRVENVGTMAVNTPLANQFVVYSDGKMYNFTSVHRPDVVIDRVSGTQYGYQIGQGGTVGYIQSGEGNRAEGYLIYEIPASFSPNTTYVVANLDNQNKAEWKLG